MTPVTGPVLPLGPLPPGYIGLCAFCIQNENASVTPRVGTRNRGRAKDLEGEQIPIREYQTMLWVPGEHIPAGTDVLARVFLMFGEDADVDRYSRGRLDPFAITTVGGTMVCALCLPEVMQQPLRTLR